MDVPQITVAELVPLHAAGATVIDVREPREYVEGHVPGAALIPLGSVPERVSEIPSGAPVYVICHSGARSNAAAEVLRANGIDAVNVAGGTMAWIQAGNEVVPGERPT